MQARRAVRDGIGTLYHVSIRRRSRTAVRWVPTICFDRPAGELPTPPSNISLWARHFVSGVQSRRMLGAAEFFQRGPQAGADDEENV